LTPLDVAKLNGSSKVLARWREIDEKRKINTDPKLPSDFLEQFALMRNQIDGANKVVSINYEIYKKLDNWKTEFEKITHAAAHKAKNAEELEEQRNIELTQMKESLRGELESKMLEIMEGRLSSDIENRMMQRFEQRLIEEKEKWQAEVNVLRNENQLLKQIIKDC
jgi:uncharacterized membrane protein